MINKAVEWLAKLTKSATKPKSIAKAYYRRLGNMNDPDIKMIMGSLAAYCWALKANGPQDKDFMMYNEGKRDAFFFILDMIGLKEADFIELNKLATKALEGQEDATTYY